MLRKLVGYAAYMFGANTFTALLNFGVSALGMVTREKAAFGDYATYMLIYEVGNGLFIYGGNATVQRFAAGSEENRRRMAKLVLVLFLGLLATTTVAAALAARALGLNVALALVGLPWVVTHWYGRYLVRARLDARREARLMMIASLSNTFFQLAFLTLTDLRDALIYGDFLALIASGVAALVIVPRSLGCSLRELLATPVPRELRAEALRFAAPLWLAGQVFTAKARLAAVFTSARLGARPMGALQALQTLWQFAGKPIEYVGQAALPGLVAARDERDELYRELLRFCLATLPLVAIVVAGGLPLVLQAIDLGAALLGRTLAEPMAVKYAEVPVLAMLPALAMPLTTLEMVTNSYSVAIGRQRTVLYAQVVNVAVIVATLYPLSTAHGLVGVAATAALGELGNALTFVVTLWGDRPAAMRTALGWSMLSTALTAAALAPVHLSRGEPWAGLAAFPAAAIYVVGLFAVRLVRPEDLRRVARAARARRAGAVSGA